MLTEHHHHGRRHARPACAPSPIDLDGIAVAGRPQPDTGKMDMAGRHAFHRHGRRIRPLEPRHVP
ncbi:hypothetical protein [Rhodanobacter aciditrophus]|uniref:hypothetical protein n=1 Tax=Rhodanobacter aciditrophus TaxID=1623218 RepID=UPI003CF64BBB